MSRMSTASCRLDAWRSARAVGKTGKSPEEPGPPPNGFSLLPWLLMGMGAFSNLFQGKTPNPWIGGLGIVAFNSLYIGVVFRAFVKEAREARSTRVMLISLGVVTCTLAIAYGGSWLLFFPLLGLATGAIVRGRWLGRTGIGLSVLAGLVSAVRDGWDAVNIAYGTFISTMVTAAILSLSEAVRELRAAREELARRAVEKERLRFSRDLHDLLGHTLSVIVVKSEAARRLAHRDLDAALVQVGDIESVGRQALTEIREAVTGYREGSLAMELDRARSALGAAGIDPVVRQSGPPLTAQTEALLGWVIREAVTNAVRHSGASRCEISVEGSSERVRARVLDDGRGIPSAPPSSAPPSSAPCPSPSPSSSAAGIGGTGLKGLTERLAAAGGSLEAGPGPRGGFLVTAELPVEPAELTEVTDPAEATDSAALPGTAA
ncbi:sensor histidine kinase [Streptomyces sporangiiformans]|uniref:Sensor histidine kinase n=1 Tax=Streptomyces sporangiiformans TaxID=2315329 RepID=A0A505D6D6_9ACTN|nr:sensor histidine kinase [Streptomyces sporangiiformans]TPQ17315.1 sensor histidine kinase [Streptomyces sporangiiformans]